MNVRFPAIAVLGVLPLVSLGAQVSYSRLASGASDDGQWLSYSGSYRSERFSPLRQISRDNVQRLHPLWLYQPAGTGALETTPIVAEGVMYITTGSPGSVVALDLKSGRPLWEWTRPMPDTVHNLGFPRTNRGIAILDGTVYVGTLDCYLVALDARSGVKRWEVHVGENGSGHSITGAPLAVDGKIIVGVSGGEAGIRGFIDAYDARRGTRVWRFWTVPSRGEKGNDTWEGESWVHGAASTWLTGSYDPTLKLLYWGTGNPGPDWNGDMRRGGSTRAAGPYSSRTWSRRRRALSCTRACRDRRTGPVRHTARRAGSSTCRSARWARTTSSRTSNIGRGRTTRAEVSECSAKNPGAQCARWTCERDDRCGISGCRRRRGRASWRPLETWSSAAPTRETSSRWTPPRESRCGSFRPAGRSVPLRSRSSPATSSGLL